MFALAALVLFALAAFGVRWESVDIMALGFVCVAVHLLIGTWPLGAIQLTRKRQ